MLWFQARRVIECRLVSCVTISVKSSARNKWSERPRLPNAIVGALRQRLADENFTNLLRAEGLDTLPQYLADGGWALGSGT